MAAGILVHKDQLFAPAGGCGCTVLAGGLFPATEGCQALDSSAHLGLGATLADTVLQAPADAGQQVAAAVAGTAPYPRRSCRFLRNVVILPLGNYTYGIQPSNISQGAANLTRDVYGLAQAVQCDYSGALQFQVQMLINNLR